MTNETDSVSQPNCTIHPFTQSHEQKDLIAALAKAQSEIRAAKKDAENPHFNSSYATLAAVWEACRKPLTDNGLAVIQIVAGRDLYTKLCHTSGQWISSCTPILTGETRGSMAQAFGSAMTYARRYALAAIVGVAPDDDDDANATGPQSKQREKTQAPKSNQPVPKESEKDKAIQDMLAYGKMHGIDTKLIGQVARQNFGQIKKWGDLSVAQIQQLISMMRAEVSARGKGPSGAPIGSPEDIAAAAAESGPSAPPPSDFAPASEVP